jgi:hypothetical protein
LHLFIKSDKTDYNYWGLSMSLITLENFIHHSSVNVNFIFFLNHFLYTAGQRSPLKHSFQFSAALFSSNSSWLSQQFHLSIFLLV